ncbi:MAG: response regulator [Deltaproteobacteria bacterium]|nr:response regulator [Deltaproteobacteria bacterium]
MTLTDSNFVYCQGCGEVVETHRLVVEGALQKRCIFCGLVLGTSVAGPATAERAIVADDAQTLSELIADLLVKGDLAREVRTCPNGREFLTEFTTALVARRPPGFVTLDVEMPLINGFQSALAMRAIERGFGHARIPIIFFSVRKCDENFRKVLKACQPAVYLNKAGTADPQVIVDRLSAIIRQVLVKNE